MGTSQGPDPAATHFRFRVVNPVMVAVVAECYLAWVSTRRGGACVLGMRTRRAFHLDLQEGRRLALAGRLRSWAWWLPQSPASCSVASRPASVVRRRKSARSSSCSSL